MTVNKTLPVLPPQVRATANGVAAGWTASGAAFGLLAYNGSASTLADVAWTLTLGAVVIYVALLVWDRAARRAEES